MSDTSLRAKLIPLIGERAATRVAVTVAGFALFLLALASPFLAIATGAINGAREAWITGRDDYVDGFRELKVCVAVIVKAWKS